MHNEDTLHLMGNKTIQAPRSARQSCQMVECNRCGFISSRYYGGHTSKKRIRYYDNENRKWGSARICPDCYEQISKVNRIKRGYTPLALMNCERCNREINRKSHTQRWCVECKEYLKTQY